MKCQSVTFISQAKNTGNSIVILDLQNPGKVLLSIQSGKWTYEISTYIYPILWPNNISTYHSNSKNTPTQQLNHKPWQTSDSFKTEHLTWGILAVKNQLIPWVPSPLIVSKNRDVIHCTEATSTLNLPHASLCPLTAGKRYPTERYKGALGEIWFCYVLFYLINTISNWKKYKGILRKI